jgi:hypothetical protein
MATNASHAAKQGDKTFSVEVRSGSEPATVLAEALSEFLDAFDCAMEWLEREDPERTKNLSIDIFATRNGFKEHAWAYPAGAGAHAPAETKPLVELFGFDPVAWQPQAREFDSARGERPRPVTPSLRQDDFADFTDFTDDEPEAPPPAVDRPSPGERLDTWLASGGRLRLRRSLLAFWDDKFSRWELILGAILLWLTVTLLAPEFLPSLLAVVAGLWLGRGRRAAPASDTSDDWF